MARDDTGSSVAPTLIAAYRATHYCVNGVATPFLLRVDEASPDLARCHLAHGVQCSAFLTAWNPGSRSTAEKENHAAQRRLHSLLRKRRYPLINGLGVDPTGQWAGEESYLVLGIERDAACDVGRVFQQHGILWSGVDAVPQLLLLA